VELLPVKARTPAGVDFESVAAGEFSAVASSTSSDGTVLVVVDAGTVVVVVESGTVVVVVSSGQG